MQNRYWEDAYIVFLVDVVRCKTLSDDYMMLAAEGLVGFYEVVSSEDIWLAPEAVAKLRECVNKFLVSYMILHRSKVLRKRCHLGPRGEPRPLFHCSIKLHFLWHLAHPKRN